MVRQVSTAQRDRRRWATGLVIALATVAAIAGAAPAGTTVPRRPRAGSPFEPRILVDLTVVRPRGLAVEGDGDLLLSEPGTRRVVRVTPAGTEVLLRLGTDRAANGLALADDGTLVVAAGTGVVTLAPDGTRRDITVPGAGEITAVDVDATGVIYANDRTEQEVLRIDPDGTITEVPFTGLGELWGIDVDDAGTVSVVDATASDIIQRTAAGVQSAAGVTGLMSPFGIDIADGRMLISDGGAGLVVREADGTVHDIATGLASPREVAWTDEGTAYVAVDGTTGCRCPSDPGNVTRVPAGGSAEVIDLGDLSSIGTPAAAGPSTVLFTSSDGAPGYSPVNPLRRIEGNGPVEELPVDGDPIAVDAAPDGTAYLVLNDGTATSLVRMAPDGTTSPVPVPSEPGLDHVALVTVDEQGRLFVAMGSGYGTGGFRVIEPLAEGGPKERYDGRRQDLVGLAAAGGALHLVVWEGQEIALLRVDLASGKVADRGTFESPPAIIDADAEGSVYVIGEVEAYPADIHVLDPAGEVTTVRYEGQSEPQRLSIGTDGTLYVVDAGIGLVALDGVGPVVDAGPPAAAPATPVPGAPSFTG